MPFGVQKEGKYADFYVTTMPYRKCLEGLLLFPRYAVVEPLVRRGESEWKGKDGH